MNVTAIASAGQQVAGARAAPASARPCAAAPAAPGSGAAARGPRRCPWPRCRPGTRRCPRPCRPRRAGTSPRSPTACATDTASAVLITAACGPSVAARVCPVRSSRNVRDEHLEHVAARRERRRRSARSSAAASASTSASSVSKSAIGNTVSKLKRRLSAALISLTPRSRVLAVAMTLNPSRANTMRVRRRSAPGSPAPGRTAATAGESCTSSGQRVISSKRTTLPSAMPRSSGAGTSDRWRRALGDEQRVVPAST